MDPAKYTKDRKIDNVDKEGDILDLEDKDYYKYFDHSSDGRNKFCKDKEDLRTKHYWRSGDFVNFYCRNTSKPIYYNAIFDPTRGVLACASVGNKK